jgi:YaiO family outer membrane protein
MLAASVEIGSGHYRAGYSLVASRPTDLDTSLAHSLRLTRDYGEASHANLSLAYGDEAETVAPGQVLVTHNKSVALHGLHWRSAAWGLGWEISYHEQGDLYHRLRFGLGLEHRF